MSFLKKRGTLAALLLLLWAGAAGAIVRDGAVPGRTGLSFHNVIYHFGHLFVNVTNKTSQNVIFGGSMLFLDRHYRPVARAELLPEKIKRRSTRRYRAVFTQGSGHEASAASFLRWEFNQRNN
ncbi:MAG: hypothetical protein K6E38_03115 [Fretibacterium sp.]|nr:hypothetical protein [Fretibacterium sp.]